MSEQAGETEELAPSGNDLFAQLMDTIAPEEGGEAPAAVGEEAPASPPAGGGGDAAAGAEAGGDQKPAGADGAPASAGDGQPGAGGDAPSGDAGAADGAAAGDAAQPGAGDRPTDWTATADSYIPKLGELSTTFEENVQKAYQAEALTGVREEYGAYFDALEKHPRMLVGQEVPSIGGEGNERLQSTQDARDWQEAVKQILAEEVRGRASVKLDENRDFLNTVHASIDLFKNNKDLIPGTKDFDVDLANSFAKFAKPYELRVDGKLQGYSVPVQPIIDQLREQLIEARKAAPPAPQTSTGGGTSTPPPPADPPQAGVQSKAGNSGEQGEDFSTLFGTIGLPNIRI